MKIIQKINLNSKDYYKNKPVTIAFIGDSVTQGCFECYEESKGVIQTVFDAKSAYSTKVKEILNILYPSAQINIINCGISGDNATNGSIRLERDVLTFNPDLVIVAFGLNDSMNKEEGLDKYITSLTKIFDELKKHNIEVIYLTSNRMSDHTSPFIANNNLMSDLSKSISSLQNSKIPDLYYNNGIKLALSKNIKVVDIYSIWQTMNKSGVNTTELLANKLNHPIRELHLYIAIKLIEKMFED